MSAIETMSRAANPIHKLVPDRGSWPALDGLRGFAGLIVLVAHLGNLGFFLGPLDHSRVGKTGVWIFFGLSAFLLTRRLRSTLQSPAAIETYAISRVFRIYPMYVVCLAAHILLRDFDLNSGIRHLALLNGWAELWTIPVEFQYYAAIPVIVLAAARWGIRPTVVGLLAGLGVALVIGIGMPESVFLNELTIMPKLAPFLLGSLLALTADPMSHRLFSKPILTGVGGIVLLTAATAVNRLVSGGHLSEVATPWISLTMGLAVVGLIDAGTRPGVVQKVLAARPLVFLGKISFSLYLTHLIIIRAAVDANLPMNTATAWMLVAICLTLASAFYYLVERLGIRVGRTLAARVSTLAAHTV